MGELKASGIVHLLIGLLHIETRSHIASDNEQLNNEPINNEPMNNPFIQIQ